MREMLSHSVYVGVLLVYGWERQRGILLVLSVRFKRS